MAVHNHPMAGARRAAGRLLKATLRRLAAFALFYSGLLWLLARYRLHRRAVVLMYHRVLPPGADTCSTDGIIVKPATFAMQMEFLKRHFQPLSAHQFRDCMTDRRLPNRACLVTFDDGWFDNEQFALPVLQQWQVPALIFLATAYVGGSRPFWQEELARLLVEAGRRAPADMTMLDDFGIAAIGDATDAEARRLAREIVTDLKSAELCDVEALRARVSPPHRPDETHARRYGDDLFLSWDAALRLSTHPLITVASHAHSHVPLTRLGRNGAQLDLLRSLQELTAHQLPTTDLCAYPNGDHDDDTVSAASEAGFTMAFTTVPGHVCAEDDRLRLRRVNIHESATSTAPEFLCRLLGLF